ncbi:sigma-70 family RNA polymerase sigma factor [Ferrovibrio sp. MS7]|nr:sigma-70 family RNA polymerase sigma factor [Ferrovibrio sp.]
MLFRRQPPHLLEAEIPRLRRYARSLCRDAAQADDLVQDSLAKALAAWGQRRDDGALRPWLFAILHNTWANGLRREGRRPDGAALDDADEPAVSGGQFERLELLDMQTALDSLSEEQRSLLLLVAVEGLSYEECARVQGVALGTVMSRLTRARDRLHRLLHGESDADPNRPRQKSPSLRRVK